MEKAGVVFNKGKTIPYNPTPAPSWEEGLASGYYKPSANMYYSNPLKQGKTFGIIKNPTAFLDVISNYTGVNLPTDGLNP